MALLLTMGVILTGCGDMVGQKVGETADEISSNKENDQDAWEDSDVQREDEEATQGEHEDIEEQSGEGEKTEQQSSDIVKITNETLEDEIKANEDATICAYVADFPVITVKGNQAATDAIAKDLEQRKRDFLTASKRMEEEAQWYYESLLEDGEVEGYGGFSNYMGYTIAENNGEILSVIYDNWSYTGGAHGSSLKVAANYSLKTGELLTFDTFFQDKDGAVKSIKENILRQCETPYYQEMLFSEYETNIDDIIKEDYWYFDNAGMHIIANEYVITPYVAGIQEFIIPYSEIPEMKQEYVKQSVFLYPALQGQTVEMDLDSDGTKETICYDVVEEDGETYIDEDGMEYEMYSGVRPSVIINDQEYGQVLMEQESYYTDNPSQYCYFVDLDTEDSYIELAMVDYGSSDNIHTYFFRYDSGEVRYLGDITDEITSSSCELFGDGTLKASIYMNMLETIRLEGEFELQGDKLREVQTDWYDISVYGEERTHEVLKKVTVYTDNNTRSNTIILDKEDGPVSFLETDNEEWVKIQTKDGDIYYLHVTGFIEIHNGDSSEEATELFGNLILAG